MSIIERIRQYISARPDRWHTPGHKGRLHEMDITEIDDAFPGGEILAAQERAAEFYGSKYVRFLTGGSSAGIKAAILCAGGDILADQNAHRAVYEGAELAGVKVHTIKCRERNGLFVPPEAEEIRKAIKAHPKAKAVLVTSPDYYGQAAKAGEVVQAVREAGRLIIADSAHGAHFPAVPELFPEGFSANADFCNLSAHKTLAAFTGSAYLCINNESYIGKADRMLELLGTTSPSYLMLGSLEYAIGFAAASRGKYKELCNEIADFKHSVPCLENDDFTRLAVDCSAMQTDGKQMYEGLKQRGIVAEKYDGRYVVFIVTADDDIQKLRRLKSGILSLSGGEKQVR